MRRRGNDPLSRRREVARGLVFDSDRILLIHWRDPVTGHEFLEPPGGRRDSEESFEEALRREIAEETGLLGLEVGDFVGKVNHLFTFAGERYDCDEHYFACRLTDGSTQPPVLDRVEKIGIVGIQWVSVGDLVHYPSGRLEPPELLEMLRRIERLPSGRARG